MPQVNCIVLSKDVWACLPKMTSEQIAIGIISVFAILIIHNLLEKGGRDL